MSKGTCTLIWRKWHIALGGGLYRPLETYVSTQWKRFYGLPL